jgi:hypothetical protein
MKHFNKVNNLFIPANESFIPSYGDDNNCILGGCNKSNNSILPQHNDREGFTLTHTSRDDLDEMYK